jgi:hypothetical protein
MTWEKFIFKLPFPNGQTCPTALVRYFFATLKILIPSADCIITSYLPVFKLSPNFVWPK